MNTKCKISKNPTFRRKLSTIGYKIALLLVDNSPFLCNIGKIMAFFTYKHSLKEKEVCMARYRSPNNTPCSFLTKKKSKRNSREFIPYCSLYLTDDSFNIFNDFGITSFLFIGSCGRFGNFEMFL